MWVLKQVALLVQCASLQAINAAPSGCQDAVHHPQRVKSKLSYVQVICRVASVATFVESAGSSIAVCAAKASTGKQHSSSATPGHCCVKA